MDVSGPKNSTKTIVFIGLKFLINFSHILSV